ncbi:MAG TPA: TIR domain-containing protein [Longimicrobium sp.]|nr:TIR domain-containing protein [Longimicrobium sp.]
MAEPTVFISYSHKDERWKDKLLPHFKQLEKLGALRVWDDRQIRVGDNWYGRIQQVLNETRFAVCLISADFLSSDFCMDEEIPFLLQKRRRGGLEILPVLVRKCLWDKHLWLRSLQMLPRDGKNVQTDFADDPDPVFTEVAERVWEALQPGYVPPTPPARPGAPPEKEEISRLPETGSLLFGRQEEIALLDASWKNASHGVIVFRAWGGVGKSTLMRVWCEAMREENYRGAERVFAWSFYSQGTGERVTSADLFIDTALRWFGDPDPTQGSPWEKGERLAELVRSRRTLLLLDGLEPLQSGSDFDRGTITDPALQTLMQELGRNGGPGLCVVTTREPMADLAEEPGVLQVDLEQVSPRSGRALLRVAGVTGEDAELEDLVLRFGRHALAINLLGSYLRERGGPTAAGEIPELHEVPENEGRQPRRVIEAWARLLGPSPELDLLKILGLFDRPASPEAIVALLAPPAIPGLTDHLSGRGEQVLTAAVQRLRELQLLDEPGHHDTRALDCHPLIREHFEDWLRRSPRAWTESNLRLFGFYSGAAPERPDTIQEMAPLFAGIRHGCNAGRASEALNLYYHGIERAAGYLTLTLGGYSSVLAVLSHFFDSPWETPAAALAEGQALFVLSNAGIVLENLGRLTDAVRPLETSLRGFREAAKWAVAAPNADQLAGLYVMMGRLDDAERCAREGLVLAELGNEPLRLLQLECTLASLRHQRGDRQGAVEEFERLLRDSAHGATPFDSSLDEHRFGDVLIDLDRVDEAMRRAYAALPRSMHRPYSLWDRGYPELTLAMAFMRMASEAGDNGYARLGQARLHLQNALRAFREGDRYSELPRVLVTRAELYRRVGQLEDARRDADTALRIARRGQMRLYEAQALLEEARLELLAAETDGTAQAKAERREKARAAWDAARRIVNETGYHRRDAEVEELRTLLDAG